MSKFNTAAAKPAVHSPVVSEQMPSGLTHEGAPGFARTAKSELFLLAVTNMGSEETFYESAKARDSRYANLVRQVAVEDLPWLAGFLPWLRETASMRTAPLIGAAEAVKALTAAGKPGGRQLVASVLQRADEPGELLAYWHANYGRAEPKPLKRGIADALLRLYTEFTLLRYDTASHGYRFGDVIERVHPSAPEPWRGALFEHAIDRRHNRDNPVPEALRMIRANIALRSAVAENPAALLDAGALKAAGMTWEDALSLAGPKLPKADLWAALIPSMGYMALLRNLRNFDEAGVSDAVAAEVTARLADPEQVARSRQFPMRFLSAYRAAPSLRWAWPLEQAITASLASIPALPGSTLVLVDTSGSMENAFSKDGTLMRWDAAAIFGIALGQRCASADVVSFSGRSYYHEARRAVTKVFPLQPGESLLRSLERWKGGGWFIGGGTDTALAIQAHLSGHGRVVIVTDEQAADGDTSREVLASVPASVPLYTWNLAGYERGHGPSGTQNRHTFGGLTDASFRMIPLLEASRDAAWPWEAAY